MHTNVLKNKTTLILGKVQEQIEKERKDITNINIRDIDLAAVKCIFESVMLYELIVSKPKNKTSEILFRDFSSMFFKVKKDAKSEKHARGIAIRKVTKELIEKGMLKESDNIKDTDVEYIPVDEDFIRESVFKMLGEAKIELRKNYYFDLTDQHLDSQIIYEFMDKMFMFVFIYYPDNPHFEKYFSQVSGDYKMLKRVASNKEGELYNEILRLREDFKEKGYIKPRRYLIK